MRVRGRRQRPGRGRAGLLGRPLGAPSGEERTLETLADIAERAGLAGVWLRRNQADMDKTLAAGKVKAFFAHMHNALGKQARLNLP